MRYISLLILVVSLIGCTQVQPVKVRTVKTSGPVVVQNDNAPINYLFYPYSRETRERIRKKVISEGASEEEAEWIVALLRKSRASYKLRLGRKMGRYYQFFLDDEKGNDNFFISFKLPEDVTFRPFLDGRVLMFRSEGKPFLRDYGLFAEENHVMVSDHFVCNARVMNGDVCWSYNMRGLSNFGANIQDFLESRAR